MPAISKLGIGLGFAAGCLATKLYYDRINPAEPTLQESHFSNVQSVCCIDTPKSTCQNIYCKARNELRLVELIDSARHTVLLSMYIFTSYRLAETIVRAFQRGVRVLIIGCRSMAHSSGSQMTKFQSLYIPVRFPLDSTMLVHHKFCLIDSKAPPTIDPPKVVTYLPNAVKLPANGVLITGSMNWTVQALSGNWDNFIVTSDPRIVDSFADEFAVMWARFHPEEQGTTKGVPMALQPHARDSV